MSILSSTSIFDVDLHAQCIAVHSSEFGQVNFSGRGGFKMARLIESDSPPGGSFGNLKKNMDNPLLIDGFPHGIIMAYDIINYGI